MRKAMSDTPICKTSVNIPEHMVQDLERIATLYGVNRTTVILWFCGEGIANHKINELKEFGLSTLPSSSLSE